MGNGNVSERVYSNLHNTFFKGFQYWKINPELRQPYRIKYVYSTMETQRTIYTVSKADIFSVTLGVVMSTVEASHANHRAVVFENDKIKIQNAINQKKHSSVGEAHEYIAALSNAAHDELELRKEQGI